MAQSTKMTQEILNILNPVHMPTVEEFMRIAELSLFASDLPKHTWTFGDKQQAAIELMQSWESITKQPLKKSHFVCEVEKPVNYESYLHYQKTGLIPCDTLEQIEWVEKCQAYQSALKEVIFEGFGGDIMSVFFPQCVIHFGKTGILLCMGSEAVGQVWVSTIFDFIFHIDRYNRTTTPILINFTSNFVKLLTP